MDKIYGYYFDDFLKYISSDKELLEEILVDDYFGYAFWIYHAPDSPYENTNDFWQKEKEYHIVPKQYIRNMESEYIE